MRAIILAAGQGTRLRPLTDHRPKCLVELADKSLLERQIDALHACGVTDLAVVAGYHAELIDALGVRVLRNPDFDTTNMTATLFCARECMEGAQDLIISYGDIVYEPRVLRALLQCAAPVGVTVDRQWRRYWQARMPDPLSDAETLKVDASNRLLEVGKRPLSYDDVHAQYMGLFKVRADYVLRFINAYDDLDRESTYDGKDFANMYMTSFLQSLIDTGWHVQAVPVENGWLETDTLEDLDLYHGLHKTGELNRFYRLT